MVLDTNVLVGAGFRPGSASARLVAAARDGRIVLVWDEATRRETERVVAKIPRLDADALAPVFAAGERWAGPVDRARAAFVEDPEDVKFAALAIAAGATLVSSDRHLTVHDGRDGLVVKGPAACLAAAGLGDDRRTDRD